jgi:transposase-like protein
MTEERMALAELPQKSGDGDFLRSVAEAVLQILMEADVEGLIGAGRHDRKSEWRDDLVGIFPNKASIIRLIGAVLLEQNDEWLLQHS